MHEYREKNSNNEQVPAQVPAVNAKDYGHNKDPTGVKLLLAEYGFQDMDVKDLNEGVQTVEQEYQSYAMGILSSPTLDILRFWEVCK